VAKLELNISFENKRAQRALGRSPEEKVKGQGEDIYRGPIINQILVEDF